MAGHFLRLALFGGVLACLSAAVKGQDEEPSLVAALARVLDEGEPQARRKAAELLGRSFEDLSPAEGALANAFQERDDPILRQNVAIALVRLRPGDQRVTSALFKAIEQGGDGVRERAEESLNRSELADEVTDLMSNALQSRNSKVRLLAAETLARLDGDNPALARTLARMVNDNDAAISAPAVMVLNDLGIGGPEAAPGLGRVLSNDQIDDSTFQGAASVIGSVAPNDRDRLIERRFAELNDSDSYVAAATALARWYPYESNIVDRFAEILGSDDIDAQRGAALAIEQIARREPDAIVPETAAPLVEQLAAMLRDDQSRSAAIQTLAALGNAAHQALPTLDGRLRANDDWTEAAAVASAMIAIDPANAAAIEWLIHAIQSERTGLAEAAYDTLLLSEVSPEAIVPALAPLLNSDDPQARARSFILIGELSSNPLEPGADFGVTDALFGALSDVRAEQDVRRAAAGALGKLHGGEPRALEALLGSLSDDDPGLRLASAKAISWAAPATEETLNLLLQATRDPEVAVADEAARAISRLALDVDGLSAQLIAVLQDPRVSASAAQALEGDTPQGIADAMAQDLREGDRSARVNAAKVIAMVGSAMSDTVPALVEALNGSAGDADLQDHLLNAIERVVYDLSRGGGGEPSHDALWPPPKWSASHSIDLHALAGNVASLEDVHQALLGVMNRGQFTERSLFTRPDVSCLCRAWSGLTP